MVVENTIYCIGGIGGKGGTYEKRLDTVNGVETLSGKVTLVLQTVALL